MARFVNSGNVLFMPESAELLRDLNVSDLKRLANLREAEKADRGLGVCIIVVRPGNNAVVVNAGGGSLPTVRRVWVKGGNCPIRVARETVLSSVYICEGTGDRALDVDAKPVRSG